MKGPRVHTLPRCVYASADYIPLCENTRGNPKESRTLGRSGEGLAPPRCWCLDSRVSQMNEAIKKEAFVVRLHQTLLGPAALNQLFGLGLVLDLDVWEKARVAVAWRSCTVITPTQPSRCLTLTKLVWEELNNGGGWFPSCGVCAISQWAGARCRGRLGGSKLPLDEWRGWVCPGMDWWPVLGVCLLPVTGGIGPSEGHGTSRC